MSTWAVLAAKQAAIATGFGAGLVPAIGTGSLDGFVIGAAITGACFTALTAPGRARRRRPDGRRGQPAGPAAGMTAAMADAEDADSARAALLRRYFAAAEQFEPDWDVRPRRPSMHLARTMGTRAGTVTAMTGRRTARAERYQSRHRLGDGARSGGRGRNPPHRAEARCPAVQLRQPADRHVRRAPCSAPPGTDRPPARPAPPGCPAPSGRPHAGPENAHREDVAVTWPGCPATRRSPKPLASGRPAPHRPPSTASGLASRWRGWVTAAELRAVAARRWGGDDGRPGALTPRGSYAGRTAQRRADGLAAAALLGCRES